MTSLPLPPLPWAMATRVPSDSDSSVSSVAMSGCCARAAPGLRAAPPADGTLPAANCWARCSTSRTDQPFSAAS